MDLTGEDYGHWREKVAETIEMMGMTFSQYCVYSGFKFHVYKEYLKVDLKKYRSTKFDILQVNWWKLPKEVSTWAFKASLG